jgi:tartrate dehydratase beta subunit/fumarate hydratase class I family protein
MGTGSGNLKKVSLNLPVTVEALADIEIGNVVYLNGVVYTAREGRLSKGPERRLRRLPDEFR